MYTHRHKHRTWNPRTGITVTQSSMQTHIGTQRHVCTHMHAHVHMDMHRPLALPQPTFKQAWRHTYICSASHTQEHTEACRGGGACSLMHQVVKRLYPEKKLGAWGRRRAGLHCQGHGRAPWRMAERRLQAGVGSQQQVVLIFRQWGPRDFQGGQSWRWVPGQEQKASVQFCSQSPVPPTPATPRKAGWQEMMPGTWG